MDYWNIRATKYNNLDWVNNKKLLEELIKFADISHNDIVLDAGCGTGVFAYNIGDIVKHIVAIDSSEAMLEKAKKHPKVVYKCWNFALESLIGNYFNKVISRMVFHHIVQPKRAIKNIYTMLAHGGWLIIEEGGIYPIEFKEVREWFADMMSLKEDRYNFSLEELISLFRVAKLANIEYKIILNENFSVNNWLDNSGQSKEICDKILNMHIESPKTIKDFYNMRINNEEVTITTNVLLMKGQKI